MSIGTILMTPNPRTRRIWEAQFDIGIPATWWKIDQNFVFVFNKIVHIIWRVVLQLNNQPLHFERIAFRLVPQSVGVLVIYAASEVMHSSDVLVWSVLSVNERI